MPEHIARTQYVFPLFKDHEINWVFKRTLEHMNEKAAEIGECLYAARNINETKIETWIKEWSELAGRVESQADNSLKEGNKISAREAYLRACNYYRTAEYGTPPRDKRFHKLWEKSRECFHKACKLFEPEIQVIEVPFEGKKLPGYYWRPKNDNKKRPTLFAVGGNDSSGEEVIILSGPAAVRRGYNFFTFEFPGHRGTVHLYPDCVKRHDMEVPFKAAFDYLEKLPGVDMNKVALTGYSFGGYVVTRVAIHEKRVKAVIPNSPLIDIVEMSTAFWGALMKSKGMMKLLMKIPDKWINVLMNWKMRKTPLIKVFREYSDWTLGMLDSSISKRLAQLDEYRKIWAVKKDLHKITCPALALVSEDEGAIMLKQAKEFIKLISSKEKEIHIFKIDKDGSNDHCQLDNTSKGAQVMFDWLSKVFKHKE